MTVGEILRAFQAAVASGELSADLSLPGLAELLTPLAVTGLPVTEGAATEEPPRSARLTGRTRYLDTDWTMRLTGTPQADGERAVLLLELTRVAASEPWTFAGAFGELPQSRRPPEGGLGGLLLGPSVLGPLILERPVLTAGNTPPEAGPRLSGTLLVLGDPVKPGSDLLARYADFLGERLPVEGPLAFPTGKLPVIELRAATSRLPLRLGDLVVSAVGVLLTTEYPDPYPIPQLGAHRSAVLLFAEVTLPTEPVRTATVGCALLCGDYVWPLLVALDPPLGLRGAVQALIQMTGAPAGDFALPPGIAPLDRFRLQDLGFGVVPLALGGPGLSYSAVSILSDQPWDPPVPFLMIDQVGTRWQFAFEAGKPTDYFGTVFGTMRFGAKAAAPTGGRAPLDARTDILVTVQVSLPELEFRAFTERPFDLPIEQAFRVFFGGDAPIDARLRCETLSMQASPTQQTFAAELTLSGDWAVTAGKVEFALTGLQLQVKAAPNAVSGLIAGKGEIRSADPTEVAYPPIELSAQARYPGEDAWEFTAAMVGTVKLPRLAQALMARQLPQWLNELEIDLTDLQLRFSTAEGRPYAASGALRAAVAETLIGIALELMLTARIERSAQGALTGSLAGSFAVNRLKVAASVSVADQGKDYTFEVAYGALSLRAATGWTGEGEQRHQILTVRLTGTLGELLSTLVALANPNATFRLDPPWNFLGGIDLSGLSLTIDPTEQSVAVEYGLTLDLGFVKITKVGLRYTRSTGTPVVEIVLDAQLLGDDAPKPLSWDPVTQAPPQPPGLGRKLFALRYLGLGQHVSPVGLTAHPGIAEVVDAMVAAMRPADPATGKAPINPATMVFDPASQWLFGIDATVMDTVAVKLVMHDPDLYGILLALNGPQAGSLAGLNVELLYKKVTDDIGVFHARLQIPDAYRKLQFGAVSVTLGVITVDIFTNGNFRIDLGFPAGGDFTNSFGLEAGYYNGRGGLYFGVLNGATSKRVPRISNGTFSPVLELGVGLSVGVGRTFQRGPLSAGVYLNLEVIFEGALAWFHPDQEGRGTALYYWCRGTVGIVGRLYGTVDFKVVRVDVNLQISAMATVELAAHQATVISLNLSVRASASVKIAFFRIKFNFSLTLQTSFEIGSTSTPPWRIVPGTALPGALVPAVSGPELAGYRLHFDPKAHVFPHGEVRTAYLSLVPGYTNAEVPVSWTGERPPAEEEPQHRLVVMLVTDNAVPFEAADIAASLRPEVSGHPRAATPADTSFDQLAEGLLRWSLNALGVTSRTVTLGQLLDLVEQLAMPEAGDQGFSWSNIEGFLTNNLHLVVSGTATGPEPTDHPGTPFPMPPVLKWTATGLPDPTERTRDFAEHQQIDATYEREAAAHFAELDPAPPQDRPTLGFPAAAEEPSASMATSVLRDYFRMVARAMAQEAVNLLTAYPHRVSRTDSLGSIAQAHGVTPESVALANPDWPVAADVPIRLGTLPVRLTAGQSLDALARLHQAAPAALLDHLRDTTPLLRTGAAVPLPGFVHTGLPVDTAAAVLYVRLGLTTPTEVPLADWYQTAIDRLNPGTGPELPNPLRVPAGYLSTGTLDWTPLPGDTVLDVAAYLALLQNPTPGTPYASWLDAVRAANTPPDPAGVRLPAGAAAVVLPNDTLRRLQHRLLLDSDRPAFDRYAAAADALVPLLTVEVPGARATTGPGLTLLTLAQQYGLGLADLARRIAADPGVLAERDAPDDPPFTVPEVPAADLDTLCAALHDGPGTVSASGQVARFMLGGLRLPAPVHDGRVYRARGPMTGGYQLIGQQVVGPPPPPAADPEPLVTFTVVKSGTADWLGFADAAVVDGRIRVEAPTAAAAVLTITGDDLRRNYPDTVLLPVVRTPLAPLPLAHPVGTRYAVTQVIPWRTTTTLHLPGDPAGPPSLWPLPAELTARAGADRSTSGFRLEQTAPQAGTGASHTELGSYAWATLVSFAVRRIPGPAGSVEVLGADTADRQRIADLLDYLRSVPGKAATGDWPTPPPGERALLTLLWQLPPAPGGLGQGLTSTQLDTRATFLVQTNLTTETSSGPSGARASSTVGRHFAALADTQRFLTLLWECSVVGGGGYWLRYQGEVPEAIFDQDGLARFSLLIQLSSQCGPDPDRHLYAFTNLAVVGDGVDPASVALTARAVDPPELRPVASVDPGQLGFTGCLVNPGDDASKQGVLRRLYGLLGFQLEPTTAFRGSVEGRAVSPRPADGTDELGLLTVAQQDEAVWDLTRVVDISRFALVRPPALPTAPPADRDPYAGIAAGAHSQVAVRFQDVFGNRSGSPARIPLPVRYTDPLIGVGGWPSTTLRYTVEPAGGQADLTVAVDLQTIAYQPGADAPGLAAAAAAARDRARLAPVYYQVNRPDVGAALLSSLHQQPGSPPTPLPVDVGELRRYLLGAHALLGSLAAIGSAPAEGAASLDEICTGYGVGYQGLGAANADAPLTAILDTDRVAVPVIAAFRNQDTVVGLCEGSGADPVEVLLHRDNAALPLNPAVELATPPRPAPVPADCPPVAELAAALHCSVTSLVTGNQQTGALLASGFVFTCNGVQVEVGRDVPADASLAEVAAEYQRRLVPYPAVQVVSLNAQLPGLFRGGAVLQVTGYLVRGGDTLLDNGTGLPPEELARPNTTTVDLFTPGTPLFLTAPLTPVPVGRTLAAFAADHATTPGTLLRHNGTVRPAAGTPPLLPGTWAWPADPDALRVPYTVRAGDSLDAVTAHFPGADLAEVNAEMPATIAAGVRITVGDREVTTTEPVSFDQACALFDPAVPLSALAAALGPRTDVLAPGALLLCPPGVLPGRPGEGVTPDQAAAAFGVGAAALLAANAGTPGLLMPGQVLKAGPAGRGGTVATETTAPRDTLTALVERLRLRGAATGVTAVVEANAGTAFLRAGARVLVPPAGARLTARLGPPEPDGDWTFPDWVFPLTVALELSRAPELVDPALAGTATRAATAVPADRGSDPQQDGALTLTAFAERVQEAVPALRLATAPGRGGDTDLWAVVFDAAGIAEVTVEPPLEIAGTDQPRTFAIRPLSTTLTARQNVTTHGFNQETGLLEGEQIRDYQGIDLEVWAQGFLADLELLLTAGYVQGAYALAPQVLDAVIDVKKTLAGAVAEGLDHVLADPDDPENPENPDDPNGLGRAAAVERLRQELLVSLTRGYATSAVIQYDTSATVPPGRRARLSGNPVADYAGAPVDRRTATLSNGKIALTDDPSHLTFLLTVPDVAAHASHDLGLAYRGVELEFDIVREIEGYERSDWLTFVTQLASGSPEELDFDLGAPRIPIPLRAYPPMPILLDQQALVDSTATELDRALRWRYRCAVQHQSAEQDTIELRVSFNEPAAQPTAAALDDLFAAMAQYTAVATPLLGLLAALPDWERADQRRREALANALTTYQQLAAEVAEAWRRHWTGPVPAPAVAAERTAGAPEIEAYRYQLRLTVERDRYRTLTLTRAVERGPDRVGWPESVFCITASGERRRLTAEGAEPGADSRSYRFPTDPDVEAFSLLTFELTFPPVHIATHQNASAATRVTRNARLLGEGWPRTAEAFVYRTPEAAAAQPVVPFIDVTHTLPIGPWAPPPAENPLEPLFRAVFDGDESGRTIAIGARYAYTLVAADPPVTALLPVVQSTVGAYTPATTVPALTRTLNDWTELERPQTAGGAWAFRLSLYSSVDPSLQRPVLQLRHLSAALGEA
ncbi:LysM domain-containing protein [Kitasatospora viridis]|uniref:LysM domain-containing protein n=1 Tax=Kitasatospora viridis TaxID=281105 RepID=UPI0011A88613|nr:LysM domain-containing protein [Kitasatospora viridis]